MFEQLVDMITLLYELAPLMLILFLFLAIMKAFDSNMGMTILITGALLISAIGLVPTGEGEDLQNFYADAKGFNYLDICTAYPIYNRTTDIQMSERNFSDGHYETLFSYEELGGGGLDLKPHKTINFNDDYLQDTLLLVTKYVYNWTVDETITISLYYKDLGNSTVNLPLIYNDYMSTTMDDNTTNNYYYIEGGLKYYGPSNQTVYQRGTNIVNANDHKNIYNQYEKNYGGSNSLTALSVQNVTIEETVSIKTNQWVSVQIRKDSFFQGNSIYNSEEFMNICIGKLNTSHTLVINDIKIENRNTKNRQLVYPFKEYYEFNEITDNTTNRVLFHIDMVQKNYQNLQVHPLELGIYSGKLRVTYDGVSYWNSTELYVDNNPSSDYFHFTGYQFNMQLDDDGNYHLYIYYKWNFNERAPGSNIVTYNYTYQKISILDHSFAYLFNFEYYDDTNNTDMQISYTQYSHKWDILDTEIRKIDYDMEQQVLLVHNVDSGGLKIPSISDLKKAFTEKIVKPISSSLNKVGRDVLGPLVIVKDTLLGLSTTVSSIGSKLTDTYDIIGSGFSSVTSTVTSSVSGLQTALVSSMGSVETAVGAVSASVDALAGYVDGLESLVGDVVSAVNDAVSEVSDLADLFVTGGDLWNLFDAIESAVFSIYNGLLDILDLTFDFMNSAGGFLILHLPRVVEYLEDTLAIMTNFVGMVGMIFGITVIYRVVLGLYMYTESGELEHLWSIFEALQTTAQIIWGLFTLLMQFIAGIIP